MSTFAISHIRARLAAAPSGPVTVDRNALEQLLVIAERVHPEAVALREFDLLRANAINDLKPAKKVKGG